MFYLQRSLSILNRKVIPWSSQTTILKLKFSSKSNEKKSKKGNLPALLSPFESISDKNKNTFLDIVTIFEDRDVHRRNHVEFIYAALKSMETFGVNYDIQVYKALINIMPKGKFIPTNIFQSEFMHYPKQQQCIIDLLEQMEDFGVIPDYEMEAMLLNVFGRRGHPLRKYWRMMYWMPKFKNLSPWPLPNPVPNETLELAKLAVMQMCSVDILSKTDVYETKEEVGDAVDETWIVSGMSSEQSKLLLAHDQAKPLYIEGPFLIWLRNKTVNYFTLRADSKPEHFKKPTLHDTDDIRNIKIPFFGQTTLKESRLSTKIRSVHEQNDGTIFAICATGTSTKDSLLSWIRILEKNGNSILGNIPILFKFRSQIDNDLVAVKNEPTTNSEK